MVKIISETKITTVGKYSLQGDINGYHIYKLNKIVKSLGRINKEQALIEFDEYIKMNENKPLNEGLSKSEARKIARDILQKAIGTAYYRLEQYEEQYSEEEIGMINSYLDIAAGRACRAIGIDYNTY